MASFSTISIRFSADLKQFSSQMANAQRELAKMGRDMQRIGSGLTVGVTLPILGIGAAAVKAASDAEETRSKFNTVFREISESAKQSAKDLRDSYGLSSQASQKLLSDTGDLLTGFGFSQQSALNLSTEVNKLAVDLASFTNFSGGAEGASQALTKALLGERESVKSLGISILESDVSAKVLKNSQQGLTFETERQAKAFATLQLAQEQSKNAIGDYARTNQGFANQMRLLKARISDVAVQFGEILLPYVAKLANKIGELVNWFSELDPSIKRIIVVVASLAAAVGPVLVSLGVLSANIIPALSAGLTALTGPIGLVIAAIAGIAIVIYRNWGRIKQELNDLKDYFTDLYNESLVFRVAVESVILTFRTLYNVVKLVLDFIITGFKNAIELILSSVENLGKAFKALITGDFSEIPKILILQGQNVKDNFSNLFNDLSVDLKSFTDAMKSDITSAVNAVEQRKRLHFNATVTVTEVTNGSAPGRNDETNGRANQSYISSITAEDYQVKSPLKDLVDNLPKQVEIVKQGFAEFRQASLDLATVVNGALEGLAEQTANFVGEFLGNLFTGQASARDAFTGILQVVANFMKNLGQALIAAGVASEAFKNIFASGVAAIVAGTALVALSTTVGNLLKSGISNTGVESPRVALASGGIAYSPVNALIGEYPGASSNPEVVAPLNKLKDLIGFDSNSSKTPVRVIGEFRLRNDVLVAAVDSGKQYLSRRR